MCAWRGTPAANTHLSLKQQQAFYESLTPGTSVLQELSREVFPNNRMVRKENQQKF